VRWRIGGADVLSLLAVGSALLLREPLVAAVLVVMLAAGRALEKMAARRAASALAALERRMPRSAHARRGDALADVPVERVVPGDELVVLPHELCPVDGVVLDGRGSMDESYLTGEPYRLSKAPGAAVLSGAINGEEALTIRATRRAAESRHASILRVLEDAERRRPPMRRVADRLAVWYAPLALTVAGAAWAASGDSRRFVAVLVIATPCPLLIAIPVAVVGAVSLAARRGIVVRDPSALERIATCRTILLDKTGTLTFGKPVMTEAAPATGFGADEVLRLAAALESYSRHPLAVPVVEAARRLRLAPAVASEVRERPGEGLQGVVEGRRVRITGRNLLDERSRALLPPAEAGLECAVLIDDEPAASLRFQDLPRPDSRPFLRHLFGRHQVHRVMLVSGDRDAEVRRLAERVGISHYAAGCSPERKVSIVRDETRRGPTLFVGDGINDAPALAAATVGVAMGGQSDVTSEAAAAVLLTPSVAKLDELLHIGAHMRRVALQSAIGGMALSLAGMACAAAGLLSPIAGAVLQEAIDMAAILNALRAARRPRTLTDF